MRVERRERRDQTRDRRDSDELVGDERTGVRIEELPRVYLHQRPKFSFVLVLVRAECVSW